MTWQRQGSEILYKNTHYRVFTLLFFLYLILMSFALFRWRESCVRLQLSLKTLFCSLWTGELFSHVCKYKTLYCCVLCHILCVCRCFALIDSSTLEQTREETETEKMTHLESLVELGLSSTFSTILTQCSMEIFKVFNIFNRIYFWHLNFFICLNVS